MNESDAMAHLELLKSGMKLLEEESVENLVSSSTYIRASVRPDGAIEEYEVRAELPKGQVYYEPVKQVVKTVISGQELTHSTFESLDSGVEALNAMEQHLDSLYNGLSMEV